MKYDLATRRKTSLIPGAFSNVSDIRSSVDTGKPGALSMNRLILCATDLFSIDFL